MPALFPINAISAPRRIAFFVNGDQNCCAGKMNKTSNALRKMGIEVNDSAWNSITAHNMGSNTKNTQNFIRSATNYFNSLPKGTEIFLIGHSFGGDSILQLLGSYRRSPVNFRLVAILDAVGNSGRRDITKHNSVPSSVDYFFNRWQTNAPWPVDVNSSGKIKCHAKTCDQKEQSITRGPDGSARKTECTRVEVCPGAGLRRSRNGIPFYYSGEKQRRLYHQNVPTDPYIEEQLTKIVAQLICYAESSYSRSEYAQYGIQISDCDAKHWDNHRNNVGQTKWEQDFHRDVVQRLFSKCHDPIGDHLQHWINHSVNKKESPKKFVDDVRNDWRCK